jgi:rare lipoprotein A
MLLGLTAANCAGPQVANRKGGGNKYGVKASPRVIPEGQPIPKGGGRDMVGQPYVVGGRTYVPHSGKGYVREGWASWYGSAFHGRLTANGEVFDRQSIAAAHPTLPLPSYVRVTNLVNKRSMVVRVNDRGPYEHDRMLDVSERVADALDFRRKGVTRVRVEFVGKASTRGSDDEKLLATLRLDGSPAPFGRSQAPTMFADRGHGPPPRPAPPRITVAEAAPASELEDEVPAPISRRQPPPPKPMAAAIERFALAPDRTVAAPTTRRTPAAEPAASGAPLPIINPLPPQRPVLAGIY